MSSLSRDRIQDESADMALCLMLDALWDAMMDEESDPDYSPLPADFEESFRSPGAWGGYDDNPVACPHGTDVGEWCQACVMDRL